MAKTAPFIFELTCIEFSTKFGGSVTAQNFISKALRVGGGGGGGNSGFSFLGVVSLKLVALSSIKSLPQIQC